MFQKMMDAGTGGSGSGGQADPAGQGAAPSGDALTYETWLAKQDEPTKGLLDTHIKGLKSALESERVSRKDFEKQLRDMARKAEDGSDAQKKLVELADQVTASDRKADFYEEAHQAGVRNIKLAYIVATNEKLFDAKGRVNFEAMKKDYPELFGGTPIPAGNAGSGTERNPAGPVDMNARIRKAAGRA